MAGTPDSSLPPVRIRVNPRARRFILRRIAGELVLTAPPFATSSQIDEVAARLIPRFIATEQRRGKQGARYLPGQVIENEFMKVELRSSGSPGTKIKVRTLSAGNFVIDIDTSLDTHSPEVTSAITGLLMRMARHTAQSAILADARDTARTLGVEPAAWKTGLALRTLGTCSSTRIVTLSAALAFLPSSLRQYIVCHELAHLSEMNHSARFHQICNRYCLRATGLSEKHLIAELRRHSWQIIR